MPHRLEESIIKETLNQMLKSSMVVLIGNCVAALTLGFYIWWLTDMPFFIGWAGGMVLMICLRYWLVSYCAHADPSKLNPQQKHDCVCMGMLATGIGWSLFAQYVFLYLDPSLHSLMYITIAGVVSAALATSAGSTRGFALFSFPILIPMAILHMVLGNAEQMLLGALVLIFSGIMWSTARHIARFVRESIVYNFENKELLDNLVNEKEHIMMLNDRLNLDLKKRVGVMEWLASGRHDHGDMTEEMHVLSSQDALTGLSNKRRFNEVLKSEWARSRREETPVAVIKCDVDYFKSFNDSLGQQEGDLCLSTIANCLSSFARRTTDLVARYGEDEFVVLLPGTEEGDALLIAEEMRTAIVRQNIPSPNPEISSQVTLTLGVSALVPRANLTEMTLIKQADIALYRAKQQGRNRVNSFSNANQTQKVTIRDLIKSPQQKDPH